MYLLLLRASRHNWYKNFMKSHLNFYNMPIIHMISMTYNYKYTSKYTIMTSLDIFEAFSGTLIKLVSNKQVGLNKRARLTEFFICYIKSNQSWGFSFSFVTWATASRLENFSIINKRTFLFIRDLKHSKQGEKISREIINAPLKWIWTHSVQAG